MKFHQAGATLFVPDGRPLAAACARVTHLGIGAHHDDLEFMAYAGIAECYHQEDRAFGGVTCTDGRGSARQGAYANHTDEQLMEVRREEQNEAARRGEYALMVQLHHPSAGLRQGLSRELTEDLAEILAVTRPRFVYTHNPADKHDTHIAVLASALQALRALPVEQRPEKVWGCEVWRGLDWLPDGEKVLQDTGGHPELAERLHAVFASQIAGGKRYDRAVTGRWEANATFLQPHRVDAFSRVAVAMDLTPLIHDPRLGVLEFVTAAIDRFRAEVVAKWEGRREI